MHTWESHGYGAQWHPIPKHAEIVTSYYCFCNTGIKRYEQTFLSGHSWSNTVPSLLTGPLIIPSPQPLAVLSRAAHKSVSVLPSLRDMTLVFVSRNCIYVPVRVQLGDKQLCENRDTTLKTNEVIFPTLVSFFLNTAYKIKMTSNRNPVLNKGRSYWMLDLCLTFIYFRKLYTS